MKSLKERNQAVVGGVTLVLIVAVALAAFYAERLPFIGSAGTEYTAQFAESAGLSVDDEVRVAGIRVGKVMKVGLDKGRVVVRFRVDGVRVGDQSRVGIEIKTLLGEKFLAVLPAGSRDQDPDTVIPVARTSTPFEIPDAFGQLSTTVDQINTTQLAQSFRVLATTFANTPDEFGKTLDGLSRLSETIASRDQQLTALLASASNVSGVLAGRNEQVGTLLTDGSRLLDELNRRKDAINTLLVGTQRLADELRGLVQDNQDQLNPALEELDGVTKLLQRNQDALSHGVAALAPYVRASNNLVGNGRWFDGALCGLLSPTINVQGLQLNPGTCGPPETKDGPLPSGGRK
ncbi:MCE family protein [Pseudonocardia spinosispora]|uniref:MCE family protein n=1 Tax=Pseudonocardia spinosispora TaxID=103441 RepID=UPI0004274F81|nr:MCE family protein [Pseudonocardia spinosispora]